MGLMDLARGGGNNHPDTVKKSNSALAQRYLAAIDGEAIELLLPTSSGGGGVGDASSPKSRHRHRHRHRQPVPTSPSVRSRSSHTTKSTKYTVRTAGSDSAIWNDTTTTNNSNNYNNATTTTTTRTPTSSSSSSPLKSRRKPQQQQQTQEQQQPSHPSPSDSIPHNHHHEPKKYHPERESQQQQQLPQPRLRRGLFPRRSLLVTSSNNSHTVNHTTNDTPPTTTTTTTTKIPKSTTTLVTAAAPSSSSLLRKWNTGRTTSTIRNVGGSSNNDNTGGKRNNNQYHQHHQQQQPRDDDDNDDDDDSSLTSRRTAESKESPYRASTTNNNIKNTSDSHPRRGRSLRRRDDEETSSSSSIDDDDDDDDNDESTSSGIDDNNNNNNIYRISHHHPEPQRKVVVQPQQQPSRNDQHIKNHRRHFSTEKTTFDQAVEKGLDMILNTNAWTCAAPQEQQQQIQPQQQAKPKIRLPIPRSARDTPPQPPTMGMMTRSTEQSSLNHFQYPTASLTQLVTTTTPPAHERRKQRHNDHHNHDMLLGHTLSADTPRSDVTGAATEIATNRAIDIAMKRIRDMDSQHSRRTSNNTNNTATIGNNSRNEIINSTSGIHINHQQQSRSPSTSGSTTMLRPDPPESYLPTKSSNSTTTTATRTNRVKQVAMNFERNKSQNTLATVSSNHRIDDLKSRTYENNPLIVSTSTTNGRLGQHFHGTTFQNYPRQEGVSERSVGTLKSLSSSVGVEIDDRISRIPVHSTLNSYADGKKRRSHIPVNSPTRQLLRSDDNWTQAPLPYNPEITGSRIGQRFSGKTRSVIEAIPSTPVSSKFRGPTTSAGIYNTIDPCMSPPQIVRTSHSRDEPSPDPIFCSKSMSMSIHSSILFSPQQSSNASVEASFQSDDAMFMEKLEESCSSVISHAHNGKVEEVLSITQIRSLDLSPSSKFLPKITPEVSGHTETTYDSHTDEDVTSPNSEEPFSPYMEILGIKDRFPSTPLITHESFTAIPRQQHDLQQYPSPESRLVRGIPFDLPSPPPLIDDTLSLSREYHTSSSLLDDEISAKKGHFGQRRVFQKSSYIGKTVFHIPVAKPEPIRSRPNQSSIGFGMDSTRSAKYSGNSALASKLSQSVASTNDSDVEIRSVDVKSIRSAFESIMGLRDHTVEEEEEDEDDDVASVRSLRERFEPPRIVSPSESSVSKARAIFERNNAKSYSRPDVVVNSRASRILDRRVHRIDVNHCVNEPVMYLPNDLDIESDKDIDFENANTVDSSSVKKPFSVADRVRVFSGGQSKNAKARNNNNKHSQAPQVDPPSSSMMPELTTTPPKELSVTTKRSPRNRILTLRALSGKAFKCGPSKDSSNSFSFEDTLNVTSDSKEILNKMQKDINDQPNSTNIQNIENDKQHRVASSTIILSEAVEVKEPSKTSAGRIQYIQPDSKSNLFASGGATKPLWMEQREKILSKSRHSSRMTTAACESKRETALVTSNVGNDVMTSNSENDIVYFGEVQETLSKGKEVDKMEINAANDDVVKGVTEHAHHLKTTDELSKETIDQYNMHAQPAYLLRRSSSENLKPAYKLRRTMSESVCPRATVTSEQQVLPFCLQSPNSNEELISNGHIEAADDPTINLDDLCDEKKEESSHERAQYSETSKSTAENNLGKDVMSQVVNYGKNQETIESRPVVVKPVARKPYVRPVPIKPTIKTMPVIPFGRSVSDPTATTLPSMLSSTTQRSEADSRFVPRALADKNYATLELPRLVDGILEPVLMEDIIDSDSENSEFSDGVTLDLSIADVSNLTNPTALISKIGGGHLEEDQTRSEMSNDDSPLVRDITRKKRDSDGDAKQSEASSSQTSEAAAPLLARALRTFPLSDEISTDSFFRARAIAAKNQWNTREHSKSSKSSYALFESSKDDDSQYGSDIDGIWDIRQVESLFPTTNTIEQIQAGAALEVWQPFPLHFESNESPKAVTGIVPMNRENDFVQSDILAANATPSQSKTPTRRNTARTIQVASLNATVLLPTLDDEVQEGNFSVSSTFYSKAMTDATSKQQIDSEASYPLLSTTSSNISGKTNRTVVSHLLLSSMSGATSLSSGYYNKSSATSTVPVSNKSTASTSTVSTYGPKHSALLARIHALKESRLRRASRMAPYSRRPSTALAYQASIQQQYY